MKVFKIILYVLILTPFFSFAQENADSTKSRKVIFLSYESPVGFVSYSDKDISNQILSNGFISKISPIRTPFVWNARREFTLEFLLSNYLSMGVKSYIIESTSSSFSIPDNYSFYDNQQTLYTADLYLILGYNKIGSNGIFFAYKFHKLKDINIKIESGVDFINISREINSFLFMEDYSTFNGSVNLRQHNDNFEDKKYVNKTGFSTGFSIEIPAQTFLFFTTSVRFSFIGKDTIDTIYEGEPYEINAFNVSCNYRTVNIGIGLRL
ncbi:MAG: hypothetical protein OEY34_05210 [Cyclobacteriaceae bacterium]|nr:hypothetical protein [Cyclobacteriaceae bacterium]